MGPGVTKGLAVLVIKPSQQIISWRLAQSEVKTQKSSSFLTMSSVLPPPIDSQREGTKGFNLSVDIWPHVEDAGRPY